MRMLRSLIIRREDHKRDALGAVFIGAITDERQIQSYVERYLGPAVLVRSVRIEGNALQVMVQAPAFEAESQNLVRLARSLFEKGRLRAAEDMFHEALRLDPLSVDALKGHAKLCGARRDWALAHEYWARAGEARGYDAEILRGLARVALEEGRHPSAREYLEEALLVDPADAESRALLDELKRQIELRFAAQSDEEPCKS